MSLIREVFSKIRDVAWDIINPATEEKQDTIIWYVDWIETELIILNTKDFSTENTLGLVKDNQTNWTQISKIHDWDWNIIKSYEWYTSDDLYCSNVSRWLITWARDFSWYWKITTSWAVVNWIIHPLAWTTQPLYAGATWIQMQIVSSSANDTALWTWIRKIVIHFINNNWDLASEEIILNWTTPVNTISTEIRFVQCMHLIEVWSLTHAAWNISLTDLAWTTTYAYIPTTENRCSSSVRYVPNGKNLVIKSFYASSISWTSAARSRVAFCWTRLEWYNLLEEKILFPYMEIWEQDWSNSLSLDQPMIIPENTIIWFILNCDKTVTVNAWFNWYIENNT